MDEETRIQSEQLNEEVMAIASQQYPSLCELETLGVNIKSFHPSLHTDPNKIVASWKLALSDSIHSGVPAKTSTVANINSPSLSRQTSQHSSYVPYLHYTSINSSRRQTSVNPNFT